MPSVRSGTAQFLVTVTVLLAGTPSAEAQCPPPPPLAAPENSPYARSGAVQQGTPENGGRRSITATRLADGESVEIDGRLDEAVWSRVLPVGDFIQIDPNKNWLDDPLLSRFATLDKRFASKILYTYRF